MSQARAQPVHVGGLGETWARQHQEEVGAGDSSEGSSVALNLATSADLSPSSPNCSYDTDGLPSSPPLASSSPQPTQPPLSPTSSTLRTVQSTLATVQSLKACLSQMTVPQPLWPPPMQNLLPMPSALPPLPRLNTNGEVENLRMLLQQQQQAVQQAQQAQAMFLFHPGPAAGQSTALLLQAQVQQLVAQATHQLHALQRIQEKEQQLEETTSSRPVSPPVKQESLRHFSPSPRLSPHLTPSSLPSLSPPRSTLPFSHSLPPPSFQSLHQGHPAPQQPPFHPPPFPRDPSCHSMPCLDLPADENIELEELEEFAKEFKQRRIKLGYTQGDVGLAMGRMYGNDFSQTTISRFEALNLSFKNMCKLKPLLAKWLEDADSSQTAQAQLMSQAASLTAAQEALARRRKKRTSIDNTIRVALERAFNSNPKPSSEEVQYISDGLCMEKEVVRVWFCNRRQKEKRLNPNYSSPSSSPGPPDEYTSTNPTPPSSMTPTPPLSLTPGTLPLSMASPLPMSMSGPPPYKILPDYMYAASTQ